MHRGQNIEQHVHNNDARHPISKVTERPAQQAAEHRVVCGERCVNAFPSKLDPYAKFCPCCGRRAIRTKQNEKAAPPDVVDMDGKPQSCGPWTVSKNSDRCFSQGFGDPFHDLGKALSSGSWHAQKPISSGRKQYSDEDIARRTADRTIWFDQENTFDKVPHELSQFQLQRQSSRIINLKGKPRCPPRVTTPDVAQDDIERPCSDLGIHSFSVSKTAGGGLELNLRKNGICSQASNHTFTSESSSQQLPARARSTTPFGGASKSILLLKSKQRKIQSTTNKSETDEAREDKAELNGSGVEQGLPGQIKQVVVAPGYEVPPSETKRDQLSWGRHSKAAQRLSVYIQKAVSVEMGSEDQVKHNEHLLSTVNLLYPDNKSVTAVITDMGQSPSLETRNPVTTENSSISFQKSATAHRVSPTAELDGSKRMLKANQARKMRQNSIETVAAPSPTSTMPAVVGSRCNSYPVIEDSHWTPDRKDPTSMKAEAISKVSYDLDDRSGYNLNKEDIQPDCHSALHSGPRDISFQDDKSFLVYSDASDPGREFGRHNMDATNQLHDDTANSSVFLTSGNICEASPLQSDGHSSPPKKQGSNHAVVEGSGQRKAAASPARRDEPVSIAFLGPLGSHPSHLMGGSLLGQAPPGKETIFTSFALNLVRERRLPRDAGCTTMPLHEYNQQVNESLRATQDLIAEMQAHNDRKQEGRATYVLYRKKGLDEVAREALQRFMFGRLALLWIAWSELTHEARNLRTLKSRITAPRPADLPTVLQPKMVKAPNRLHL